MALVIPITGVPETYRVPGAYIQLLFGQGPSSAKVGVREVCLAMPISDSADWTAGTLYEIDNEQDAIDGAGDGFPLHRGARRYLRSNQNSKLWALPVAETTGGTEVQGTFAVTFTTNPTASGSATVWVCGESSTYTYTSSDTVTTVAAGLKAVINAKTWLPVTADNSSGVLTLTAKLAGVTQNNAINVRSTVTVGTGISVSADGEIGDTVAGSDGATAESANLTTALANITSTHIYYLVTSATDTTNIGILVSHLTNKEAPKIGLRSVGIAASRDTVANVTTLANTHNYARQQIVWQEDSDDDPASIAANMAAVRAKWENTDPAYPLAGYGESDWLVPAAFDSADWPTGDEQSEAINDGVTPIATKKAGAGSYIVMSVNTRSKNSAGTVDDFRACETHRVSVGDAVADEIVSLWNGNHLAKKLDDDETLADGTVNPNQTLRRGVLKPSQWKKEVQDSLENHSTRGRGQVWLQQIDASLASVRVVKTGSRLETSCDIATIDHALQMTTLISETSGG